MYNGQAHQDQFVLNVLKFKRNGWFLEIGSNDPININNTFLLENKYNWQGLLVEYDQSWEKSYQTIRYRSNYVIADATKIDYATLLRICKFPKDIDYLQIDLEVENKSTLDTLLVLDETIFDKYRFAVVTFEHDIYRGDFFNTRKISREIFSKRGYVRVFQDVTNDNTPYEDWYVHPELVDMDYINSIKSERSMEHSEIVKNMI